MRQPPTTTAAAVVPLHICCSVGQQVYVITVGLSLPVNSCSLDRSRATCNTAQINMHFRNLIAGRFLHALLWVLIISALHAALC